MSMADTAVNATGLSLYIYIYGWILRMYIYTSEKDQFARMYYWYIYSMYIYSIQIAKECSTTPKN